jgi:TrmH family RNA methyltransferase
MTQHDIITSVHNETVKKIVTLHSTKGRATHKLFIAEGSRTCDSLFQSPLKPVHLYVVDEQRAYAEKSGIAWTLVSPLVMEKMSCSQTPAGILALFEIPSFQGHHFSPPGLVCADIKDPGNLGTLIRTAAAYNFKTIVLIEGVDSWNPKVVQASAGTIGFVELYNMKWNDFIKTVDRKLLCALVADQKSSPATGSLLKDKFIVVGNEAHGIKKEWFADCQTHITIAMPGKTESLNAAVAGSIAMYIAHQQ